MSQHQPILRQPFTVEEKSAYGSLFKSLDKESLGIVTGEIARPIFERSGLSTTLLREIWQLADREGNGFLTEFAFFVSLRLIGHCQNGGRPSVELMNISGPLANLNGSNHAQAPINRQLSGAQSSRLSSFQATGPIFPPLTSLDVAKFSQLFQRTAQGGNLDGDHAKSIFMKANLPTTALGQIWNVVDREQSGDLSQQEFIIAMYLIQSIIGGTMKQVPQFVPNAIWDIAATAPATQLKKVPLAVPPHRTSSIQERSSSQNRLSGSHTTSPPPSDWVVSASQKQQSESIFDNLDKSKKGTLSPNEVAQFLMTSNLPQETLGTIWDLADVENSGEFTKREFNIALYLVNRKLAGGDLPNVVPESLIQSAAQTVASPTQRNASVTHNPAAAQPPQFKTQSSINDLVSLNDLFTSPVVTPTVPKATTLTSKPTLHSSLTGSRAPFVPSSSFGQQMLSEQQKELRAEPPSLLEESEDEDDGPISAEPQRAFSSRPTIPAREQKPSFTGDNLTSAPTGTNYDALRGFSGQQQQPQQPQQQPTFTSQPAQTSNFSTQANLVPQRAPTASTNTDLLADSEVSGQLSLATTDIANISNQINSLTTQTTQLNDKRERASGELNRILLLKKDIESKLTKLRALYDQEVKQVQEVESVLLQSKQETEALKKETALTEANYHATQTQLQLMQVQYEESQKEIETLKEKLGIMNAENIELKNQHEQIVQQQKQSASMLSVTQQQVNVLESKNMSLRSELEKSNKEVSSIEDEHASAKSKLESLKAEIPMLTAAISAAAATVSMTKSLLKGTQSRIDYHTQQKKDLEEQHLQYQQSDEPVDATRELQDIPDTALELQAPSVGSTESNTRAASSVKNTTETPASSVAGSDIQYTQQYQNFNLPLARPHSTSSSVLNNPSMSVRGEDNVSEPASPSSVEEEVATPTATISNQMHPHNEQTSQDFVNQLDTDVQGTSQTSSTGESFELVEAENDDATTIQRKDTNEQLADNTVFSQQDGPSSSDLTIKPQEPTPVDDQSLDVEPEVSMIPGAFIASPSQPKSVEFETPPPTVKETPTEEFPPIKELDYDESDSSDDDNDSFHDTNNISVSKSTDDDGRYDDALDTMPEQPIDEFADLNPAVDEPAGGNDAFDEFADLEEALPEGQLVSAFEDSADTAFDQGFSDSAVTAAATGSQNDLFNSFGDLEPSTTETNNEEWEQLFEGFGNSSTANFNQGQQEQLIPVSVAMAHPQIVPVIGSHQSSQLQELAIKELTGMGFTEQAAIEALNKNNWNLENATNHLLDNA